MCYGSGPLKMLQQPIEISLFCHRKLLAGQILGNPNAPTDLQGIYIKGFTYEYVGDNLVWYLLAVHLPMIFWSTIVSYVLNFL